MSLFGPGWKLWACISEEEYKNLPTVKPDEIPLRDWEIYQAAMSYDQDQDDSIAEFQRLGAIDEHETYGPVIAFLDIRDSVYVVLNHLFPPVDQVLAPLPSMVRNSLSRRYAVITPAGLSEANYWGLSVGNIGKKSREMIRQFFPEHAIWKPCPCCEGKGQVREL